MNFLTSNFLEEFLYFLLSRRADSSSFMTIFLTSSAYLLVVPSENQVNRPKPHRKGCGLPDEAVLQKDVSYTLPPFVVETCNWILVFTAER